VGTILEWEPPSRFLMTWQLTPDWAFEPDLERATKVEVVFEEEGEGDATRVSLEHRGFEAYGDSGAKMRGEVGGEGGWPALMNFYAEEAGR
jgi:uncharacterized protein YndB with AHSA1/START domain